MICFYHQIPQMFLLYRSLSLCIMQCAVCIINLLNNNLNQMTTLPLINKVEPKQRTRQNISYLRFPANSQAKSARCSLQQQTYSAMHNHKYLYIDFQTDSKVFELEKTDQINKDQEQAQQIGDSRIGGFDVLSKISPSGYRMHKFLSQQKIYFDRKKKWKTLLKRNLDDTQMNFNKIRQKINPQKLEDYLENKHNEENWKKIQQRQQKLYEQISNQDTKNIEEILTTNQNRINVYRCLRSRNDFKGKVKLKALNKLTSLLYNS